MSRGFRLIAWQEFTLHRRNRWVVSFGVLFALLTLVIAFFGMVTSGYAGFQDFIRTSASLIGLTGFVAPLFALLLGVQSFVIDPAYFELLTTQPITRRQILLGKYTGLFMTLCVTMGLGFGIAGVIIALRIGLIGALAFAWVVLLSIALGAVFIGLAVLLAVVLHRRPVALGAAIGVWLFFELVYGLFVLGSTLYLEPTTLQPTLVVALLGNPVDLIRVLSLLATAGTHFFGPAGATLLRLSGSESAMYAVATAGVIFWLVAPPFIAAKLFARQDI